MIYSINKPIGWTSFDVVKKIRGITREKKVGHAGTLDPFAEGVLIIGTGKDTKKLTSISSSIKSYRAILKLGKTTDTLDNEGEVTNKMEVPTFDKVKIENVLISFKGDYLHMPPMYSAKRVKGVRLYKLARQNIVVEREPVNVSILEISLNNFNKNEIDFSVTCSKGTYIRVLGQDIAKKLGTIGYLTKLVRIEVGPYNINNSTSIKTFEEKWKSTNR
ncbi:MAG: tRNA pseudouridine(55) synthase TruB [Candidatus Marinimicrobia bacterium]|nr:tRNA pseudouridine(55) synthase TruB [Candidatus Neomarinimicrobiota bacterium]